MESEHRQTRMESHVAQIILPVQKNWFSSLMLVVVEDLSGG